MPIALLLQEITYTFCWGAYHLEPWMHLVRTEELLIDRARGAFLVHWFGRDVPLDGFFVRVAINNLAAVRAQYFIAARSLLADAEGPNLFEPLAGITGTIAGIALSPTTTVLAIVVIVSRLGPLVKRLGWWAVVLPLGVPLGQGVVLAAAGPLLPIAIAGSVFLVSNYPDETRKVYLLLGSVARFLIAGARFLDLLSGPRENVKNPLLSSILEMFDRLAGLVPFVLAFVAVMIDRVGPLIAPLAAQIEPFRALIEETFATVAFIFGDIPRTFERFWPAVADKVDFVLVQLSLIFPVFGIVFTELFTNLTEQIGTIVDKATTAITDWFADAKKAVTEIINAQPLSVALKSATLSFEVAARYLSSGSSSSSSSSSSASLPASFPQLSLTSPEAFMRAMGGPPPGGLGAIETLGKIDIKYGGALFEDYIPFSDRAREGVAAGLQPTTVFQAERGALARSLGAGSPEQALAELRTEQLGLRDLISGVVGRILPPALRTEVYMLRGYFDELDRSLYQAKLEKATDFPVQDLADNGKLRPIVRRLVIRGADIVRADVDTFQARLQDLLTTQPYLAEPPPDDFALVRG